MLEIKTVTKQIFPQKNANDIYNLLENIPNKLDEIFELVNAAKESRVVYISTETNKVIPQKCFIIERILKNTQKINEIFDDELEKLQIVFSIKDDIKQLKDLINRDTEKYYYRACITIHDAIMHIKSEELSKEQIDALKYCIGKLNQETLDRDECFDIDTILYREGLDCIPDYDD